MIKVESLEYKYEDGTVALKDVDIDLDKGNIDNGYKGTSIR